MLKTCGFGVVAATDGEEGLIKFDENEIDIVMTDLMMPKVNGLKVLESIKKKSPETPVIMLSGAGEFDDVIKALNLGADQYLLKPPTIDIFIHSVERAWELLNLSRENANYKLRLEGMVEAKTEELREVLKNLNLAKDLLIDSNKKREIAYKELKRNETKYRKLFDMSPIGITIVDSNYQITEFNQAFLDIMGFNTESELLEEDILTSPMFISSRITENLLQCLQGSEECFLEKEFTTIEGDNKHIKYSLTPLQSPEIVKDVLLFVEDITLRKIGEMEKERRAKFCQLTGLINQNNFYLTVENVIEDAHKKSFNLALVHIDIDDFKIINDKFGHPGGNNILRSVGKRIKNETSVKFDYGFRVGGDEFAILITHYPEDKLKAIVDRVFCSLSNPYSINGSEINCTFCLGIAEYNGQTPQQFHQEADTATYNSKNEGKNTTRYYQPGMMMPELSNN